MTDAAPDGGDTETGDPALIIESELPLSECDVGFDKVYEIPGTKSARAWSVVELPSGHFVVAGEATPAEPTTSWDVDGFLMEVDGNGEMVWAKTYGKEDGEDESNDMDTLASVFAFDECLLSFGMTEREADHGLWALKTSLTGEEEWSEKLSISGNGKSTHRMNETEVLLLGRNDEGPLIALYSVDGELTKLKEETEWEDDLSVGILSPMEGGGWARGGYSTTEVDGTNFSPNEDVYQYPFIAYFGSDHEMGFQRTLDPGYSGIFTAAAESPDGSILAGGNLQFDDDRWGSYFAQIDLSGDVIWNKLYKLPDNKNMYGPDAILEVEGGIIYVCNGNHLGVQADGYISRLDEEGHVVWHTLIERETHDSFVDIMETKDADYLVIGFGGPADASDLQVRIVKIEPNSECY